MSALDRFHCACPLDYDTIFCKALIVPKTYNSIRLLLYQSTFCFWFLFFAYLHYRACKEFNWDTFWQCEVEISSLIECFDFDYSTHMHSRIASLRTRAGTIIKYQFFTLDLKEASVSAFLATSGRKFHRIGPIWEKVSVTVLNLYTFGAVSTYFLSIDYLSSFSVILNGILFDIRNLIL